MKNSVLPGALALILILAATCKNAPEKNVSESDVYNPAGTERLSRIGKDIITEVVVKPDTLGDPWEVEKVQGFDGREMFTDLLKKTYKGKLTVYDCFTERALDKAAVSKMQKEIGDDITKIGKLQFLEDWYFDPLTNRIVKKVKSVTFGYEVTREGGLPTGYKCLFRVKTD